MVDAARELTTDDIYDGLFPIDDGEERILVASLQSSEWSLAECEDGEEITTGASTDDIIWVAIPSEIEAKLLSEGVVADSLSLNNRLIEMLGLRPDGVESVVNYMWVEPSSLLRPSYDPNPTTTYGAVEYPANDELPSWYREWFDGNVEYSYESPAEGLNYPFTRLGYTYDWGEGASKYGVSEFIIVPQSEIIYAGHKSCWSYYKELINRD